MNINKEYYIDTLTILSCIAVVYLHANGFSGLIHQEDYG